MTKYRIKGKSVIGKFNESKGAENQDLVRMYEDDKIICVSVNDGCGSSEYGYEAAEINAKAAEALALDPSIWKATEKKFKEGFFSECSEKFDETGISIKELSATTAFVIINKSNNRYIAFAVGDTAIISYNHDFRPSILIAPKNGLTKNSTYFTNSSSSVKTFGSFKTGLIDNNRISGFIIYSDGAEYISNSLSSQDNYSQKLINGIYKSDAEYFKVEKIIFDSLRRFSKDDISIAVIAAIEDNPVDNDEIADISDNTESFTREYVSYSNNESVYNKEPMTETKSFENNQDDFFNYFHEDMDENNKNYTSFCSESNLLQYMNTPKSINELLKSNLVNEKNIFTTLSLLFRIGAITCIDDKFKSR